MVLFLENVLGHGSELQPVPLAYETEPNQSVISYSQKSLINISLIKNHLLSGPNIRTGQVLLDIGNYMRTFQMLRGPLL